MSRPFLSKIKAKAGGLIIIINIIIMWWDLLVASTLGRVYRWIFARIEPRYCVAAQQSSSNWHTKRKLATTFQEVFGGNIYLALRIPDTGRRGHQEIDAVVLTERDLYVLEVIDLPGVITIDNDERWSQKNDDGTVHFHPNIVANLKEKMLALSSYMERRGLKIPDHMFKTRAIFINPGSSPEQDILLQPEVISFEKWQQLTREQKNGFLGVWKDTFLDPLHKELHTILSTAPTWDRLELHGGMTILGEFVSFKGSTNDVETLRGIKRSKISRLKPYKQTSFLGFLGLPGGSVKLKLECTIRDYREGFSGQQREVNETHTNANMEIVFQVAGARKPQRFMLKDVTVLHLHA